MVMHSLKKDKKDKMHSSKKDKRFGVVGCPI